jgi:hypothetical protein
MQSKKIVHFHGIRRPITAVRIEINAAYLLVPDPFQYYSTIFSLLHDNFVSTLSQMDRMSNICLTAIMYHTDSYTEYEKQGYYNVMLLLCKN